MFSTNKRIFAGKANLQSEPFCPYLTDASGRISLLRSLGHSDRHQDAAPCTRRAHRDGKTRT